jgi:DNA repair exonuclease SbcCD nuclease subunit
VVILHGTPGHDRPGSLEIFKRLDSDRNKQEADYRNKQIIVLDRPEPFVTGDLMILPIPAVTKSGLMQKAHAEGESISPERSDQVCARLLNEMILLYKVNLAEYRKQNPDTIGIVLGHITVTGSETSTGQTILGGDVCLPVSTLAEVGADYVGLGHIHKPQEFEPNIYYAGSAFPVNWGEVEEKSFIYGEIGPGELEIERIPFPFPAMVDVTAVADDGLLRLDAENLQACHGAEVRCRVLLKPAEKDLWDSEAVFIQFADNGVAPRSIKFEKVIESEARLRCEQISTARSYHDKLKAWGETTGTDITPSVLHKLEEVELEVGHAS